ncbi:MAG: SpoVA/SpoVAEb family sporulation membrane protein [Eubacteriales bacterium]
MEYIQAFILAGILCAVFQVLLAYTKLGVPKILILSFTIGAILAAVGILPILEKLGGGGLSVLILDAGGAIFNATLASTSGNFAIFIAFLCIIFSVTVIGILTGLSYLKIHGTEREVGLNEVNQSKKA